MKKSLIIAFLILLAVVGWFLSGKISVGNENLKNQSNIQNIQNYIIFDENVMTNMVKPNNQIFQCPNFVQWTSCHHY